MQKRETSRYLLFDEQLELCGRRAGRDQEPEIVRPSEKSIALAFSGIHVISPRLLGMISEEGVFSILVSYLRLAGQGEKILAFRADEYYWRDLGKPENVRQAARDLGESGGAITRDSARAKEPTAAAEDRRIWNPEPHGFSRPSGFEIPQLFAGDSIRRTSTFADP